MICLCLPMNRSIKGDVIKRTRGIDCSLVDSFVTYPLVITVTKWARPNYLYIFPYFIHQKHETNRWLRLGWKVSFCSVKHHVFYDSHTVFTAHWSPTNVSIVAIYSEHQNQTLNIVKGYIQVKKYLYMISDVLLKMTTINVMGYKFRYQCVSSYIVLNMISNK